MLWSSLNVVVMTILFMYMVNKAKCAETRKLALVPLATAAVELLAAGPVSGAHGPADRHAAGDYRLLRGGPAAGRGHGQKPGAPARPGPAGGGRSTAAAGGSQAPPMRMTRG